ncbi:MAG TPA: ATP-binding protein [Anaerolineae bacterium]|nr:ATP-binding protein [Anaerolineae bacterium]
MTDDSGPVLVRRTTSVVKLAETLCALANGKGGTVLVGIDPRTSQAESLADPDLAIDRVLQAALSLDPPLVIPLPRLVGYGVNHVVEVVVPPGLPHAYVCQGRFLTRDGAHNRPIGSRRLNELLMARGAASVEDNVPEGARLDHIDWESAGRHASSLGMAGDAAGQLLRCGCLREIEGVLHPTLAGLLLFGLDPQRWARTARVLVVRYSGRLMADRFVKEEIAGSLPDQIRRAEAFVVSNLQRAVQITGLERDEVAEYPADVIREVIVNAVAHRDYRIGDEIRVLLFSDRLECHSPGRLPGHVTLENLVEERFSRNETIVQVLSEMGFIERLGYGIDRILRLSAEAGLPAPRFEETSGGFRVTLYGAPGAQSAEAASRRWRRLGTSDRQERALAYLVERGRITNREFQDLCPDVSSETIRRELAELVAKGLLLRIGDKRATYYILK